MILNEGCHKAAVTQCLYRQGWDNWLRGKAELSWKFFQWVSSFSWKKPVFFVFFPIIMIVADFFLPLNISLFVWFLIQKVFRLRNPRRQPLQIPFLIFVVSHYFYFESKLHVVTCQTVVRVVQLCQLKGFAVLFIFTFCYCFNFNHPHSYFDWPLHETGISLFTFRKQWCFNSFTYKAQKVLILHPYLLIFFYQE